MQQSHALRRVAFPVFLGFLLRLKEARQPIHPLSIPPNNKLVAFCLLLSIILIIVRESAVEKFDQNPSPSIKKQFNFGTRTS